LDLITYQEVPKFFSQQNLRGRVDKTTTQKSKVQQFETDRRQGLGIKKFSVNSSESSNIKIILSARISCSSIRRQPSNPRFSSSSPQSSKIRRPEQQRHLVANTTVAAVKLEEKGWGVGKKNFLK
jgi:hypothetical protein